MLNVDTYLPKLKEFEGVFSYMYVDTTGNVTVGVGKLLANAAAAQKLAFVRRADPTAKPPVVAGSASADEIKADFDRVDQQPAGKLANFYKQFTKLDLPDKVIDSLLNDHVVEFRASLRNSFPDYDSYPSEACAALFDMAFNLGLTKLTSGFPRFCRAVKEKSWAAAAKESRRNGIGDSRNDWAKAQFEQAAVDANKKPGTQ